MDQCEKGSAAYEALLTERDALKHLLMVAVDYLAEAIGSTRQYDFEVRANNFVERTRELLAARHD